MHSPIKNGRKTSGYKTLLRPTHAGMDIAMWTNSKQPVYAAFPGTVTWISRNRPYGASASTNTGPAKNRLSGSYGEIRNVGEGSSKDGEYQWYGHVELLPSIQVGDFVEAGALIGYTSLSGKTSGHHVHFVTLLKDRETTYNPANAFKRWGIVPGADTGQGAGQIIPPEPTKPPVEKPDTGFNKTVLAYQKRQNKYAKAGLKEDGIPGKYTYGWKQWVKEAQAAMNAFKSDLPDLTKDGDYGSVTAAKFKHLERRNGLKVTGILTNSRAAWMRSKGSSLRNRPKTRP